jgi:hypothetical protein
MLPGYRHAVAQLDQRLTSAVAGLVALLALAACATSPGPQPTSEPSVSSQTNASATSAAPKTTAQPQPLDREVSGYTGFISPTGNVACAIDVDLARCDIIDHDWSPPPRPPDCEFDYGQGISISPGEPAAFVCAGDTTFGTDEVLPFGDAITAGTLRCESANSGITCRDADSGHGFTLALKAYQLF